MVKTSKIKKQKIEQTLSKVSIYYQDESSFEISQTVWRVLCPSWEKPVRIKGKERRHDWLSVSWVRSLDGELHYRSSGTKTWKDFLSLLYQVRHKETKEWMIVIVDNARIHRTKALEQYCEKKKIIIVYLPPYSPDLNPIELVRKMIKKEFRKIQWMYDDIKKLVSIATKKVRNNISILSIENLINVS